MSIGAACGDDTGTGAKGGDGKAGEEAQIGDLVDEEVAVGVEGQVLVVTGLSKGDAGGDDTGAGAKGGGEEAGKEVTTICVSIFSVSNISFVL